MGVGFEFSGSGEGEGEGARPLLELHGVGRVLARLGLGGERDALRHLVRA